MGQAVSGERNHRSVELTLVVGLWNKRPGAQEGNPVAGVPEREKRWLNENWLWEGSWLGLGR